MTVALHAAARTVPSRTFSAANNVVGAVTDVVVGLSGRMPLQR